jgi:type IV pilus assembly protein PilE
MKKRQSGFSLLELMIVLVIVGILASIAIPSYRDSIRKSNRRAAQAVLMDIANRERQYFIANRAYADETELNYALPAEVAGKYTFTITPDNADTPPSFVIDFTAVGSQVADGDLSLDSEGVKGPTPEKWLP